MRSTCSVEPSLRLDLDGWLDDVMIVRVAGVPGGHTTIFCRPEPVHTLRIGGNSSSVEAFNGAIDELRISSIPRSTSWLATQLANHAEPDRFVMAGAAEPTA